MLWGFHTRVLHAANISTAPGKKRRMWDITNVDIAAGQGDLRVAFETEIIITLHEHLVID